MKIVGLISRILTGLVFVFSGFVKALDPIGSSIKFTEYFESFHLGFLIFSSLPLAILMSAAEFMIGLNLLAGIRMKFTAWILLIFMAFFTGLTFILALTNPVSDCGCFGDALKLTNWQTFLKNGILIIPAVVVFIRRRNYHPFSKPSAEWGIAGFNFLFSCIISAYCIIHQPILDFRPYRAGTFIPDQMTIPEGAPADQYETILIYEKDGLKKEFTDKNFPWQDSTWKWVETKQKLVKRGYEPPIHDFSITSPEGEDITEAVLSDSNYIFLILAPDLETASKKGLQDLNTFALKCRELGFVPIGLTSSPNNQIARYKEEYQPDYDFCTADETTLKTIIRANPGLMLLHKGTILGKWNHRDAPSAGELSSHLLSLVILREHRRIEILKVTVIALLVSLLLVLAYLNFQRPGKFRD